MAGTLGTAGIPGTLGGKWPYKTVQFFIVSIPIALKIPRNHRLASDLFLWLNANTLPMKVYIDCFIHPSSAYLSETLKTHEITSILKLFSKIFSIAYKVKQVSEELGFLGKL